MEMNYCMECGAKLHLKYHPQEEKDVPFCDACGAFRWPVFNTACSMIVMNEARDRVILIQQYNKPFYVLVAGYVNQGEDAEHAAAREVMEEMGLTVTSVHYNHSRYFAPTNTLMLNFTVTVAEHDAHPNYEVDAWRWFTVEDAKKNIKPNSLARDFLIGYFTGEYPF